MKITFAICLLLLNNFDIISQQDTTKFSFVSERNEWNILIPDYFSPEIYTETYTFSAKDTLFSHGVENPDTLSYRELILTKGDGVPQNTKQFYREEDNKVYLYYGDEDIIIYDFNKNIGDTINYHEIISHGIEYYVVNKGELMLLDGSRISRINLDCFGDNIWYQGIGSASFTFEPWNNCYYEISKILTCFSRDGILLYKNPFLTCTTGTHDLNLNLFSIYPNPAQDNIKFSGLDVGTYSYLIFNNLGQKVLEGNINNKEKIDLLNLPEGLYFITLEDSKGKNRTQNFVIQK